MSPVKKDPSLGGGKRKPDTRKRPYRPRAIKGNAIPPENPTGRLVISEGVSNGVGQTHWLPDANRTGVYSWKCPLESCGQWFVWSVDRDTWEPSTPQVATAGQSA